MNEKIRRSLRRLRTGAALVGVAGPGASVIGAVFSPKQFFASYLFGYLSWLGLGLGCLTLTMIHHLTGGRWGFAVRRFLEAGFSTLPLMTLLFMPLLFGLGEMYAWARGDEIAHAEVLQKRMSYMNAVGFIARS